MTGGGPMDGAALELRIEELLLELPGLSGREETLARQVLQEALVKLAERLERAPLPWSGEEARELRLDSLRVEGLSPEGLAEALYAQLLRGMR